MSIFTGLFKGAKSIGKLGVGGGAAGLGMSALENILNPDNDEDNNISQIIPKESITPQRPLEPSNDFSSINVLSHLEDSIYANLRILEQVDNSIDDIHPLITENSEDYNPVLQAIMKRLDLLEAKIDSQSNIMGNVETGVKKQADLTRQKHLHEKRVDDERSIELKDVATNVLGRIKDTGQGILASVMGAITPFVGAGAVAAAPLILNKLTELSGGFTNLVDNVETGFNTVAQRYVAGFGRNAGTWAGNTSNTIRANAARMSVAQPQITSITGATATPRITSITGATATPSNVRPLPSGALERARGVRVPTPTSSLTPSSSTSLSGTRAPGGGAGTASFSAGNVGRPIGQQYNKMLNHLNKFKSVINAFSKGFNKMMSSVESVMKRIGQSALFKKIARSVIKWTLIISAIDVMISIVRGRITGTMPKEEMHSKLKEQINNILGLFGGPFLLSFVLGVAGTVVPILGNLTGGVGGLAIGLLLGPKIFEMLQLDHFVNATYDFAILGDRMAYIKLAQDAVKFAMIELPKILGEKVMNEIKETRDFMRGIDRVATVEEIEKEYGADITMGQLIAEASEGLGTDENAILYAFSNVKTQQDYEAIKREFEETVMPTLDTKHTSMEEYIQSELNKDEYAQLQDQITEQIRTHRYELENKVNPLADIDVEVVADTEMYERFGDKTVKDISMVEDLMGEGMFDRIETKDEIFTAFRDTTRREFIRIENEYFNKHGKTISSIIAKEFGNETLTEFLEVLSRNTQNESNVENVTRLSNVVQFNNNEVDEYGIRRSTVSTRTVNGQIVQDGDDIELSDNEVDEYGIRRSTVSTRTVNGQIVQDGDIITNQNSYSNIKTENEKSNNRPVIVPIQVGQRNQRTRFEGEQIGTEGPASIDSARAGFSTTDPFLQTAAVS